MSTAYNVVIILKDARTTSFQANDFRSACLEMKRMLPDPFYALSMTDPVFIGSSDAHRQEYTVGELVREVA